jgi:hypothetical protein
MIIDEEDKVLLAILFVTLAIAYFVFTIKG